MMMKMKILTNSTVSKWALKTSRSTWEHGSEYWKPFECLELIQHATMEDAESDVQVQKRLWAHDQCFCFQI